MVKYFVILIFLKSNLADHYDYKYDDYNDYDIVSGDDYMYNETQKPKPLRINSPPLKFDESDERGINLTNKDADKVEHLSSGRPNVSGALLKTSLIDHTRSPRSLRLRRDCNYTTREATDNGNSPTPDKSDNIQTYPFAASILRLGSHYASGALVDKRWVLTAAGVFYKYVFSVRESIKLFKVRLGSVNCKRGGILSPLRQIVIHPAYMLGKPENDLALLRLANAVDISESVHPISLTDRKGKVEVAKFLTMYWPRLIVDSKPLPPSAKERTQHTNMRVSAQRVLPWKQCWRALSYRLQDLSQNSFCLRPLKQFHTICLTDVGAPVLSQDGLWGIVSGWVGDPCTFGDPSPVVVSRISPPAIRYWLEQQFESEE